MECGTFNVNVNVIFPYSDLTMSYSYVLRVMIFRVDCTYMFCHEKIRAGTGKHSKACPAYTAQRLSVVLDIALLTFLAASFW